MLKIGQLTRWQAARCIRSGILIGIEGKILTMRDPSGTLWLVNRDDVIEGKE